MRLRLVSALLAVLLAGSVCRVLAADDAAEVSFQDVEESLTCQCGCGLTVHSCNHLQCGSALPLREEIREQMAQGKGKEAILAHFSEKYGEKILSAPTTAGFNLLAWVTPFILVGLGGVFVGITLLRWRARGQVTTASKVKRAEPATRSAHDETLERELKNFDA